MTTNEAITWFEHRKSGATMPGARMAFDAALEALRAQQKQTNEPLTYEQLQQMDGQPVYLTGKHLAPSWDIVAIDYDHDWPIVYFHYKYRGALQRNGYGKTWLAYRHKPEQEVQGSD